MADNPTTSAGGVLASTQLRAKDTGTGQAFMEFSGPWPYTPTGKDFAIAVTTSAVVKSGAGITIPAGTTHALISVEGSDVRFTEDGTAPTSSNGVLLSNGTLIELPIPATPANLQFIGSGATATLNFNYRKYV